MSALYKTHRDAAGYLYAVPVEKLLYPCPWCLVESTDAESLRWHMVQFHASERETDEVLLDAVNVASGRTDEKETR